MLKIDERSRKFLQLIFSEKKYNNVTIDDLILFTDQIHALFKSGFTFSSSVDVMHDLTESENMKDALKAIRIALEKGLPLSKSIAMYPDIFPEYYIQNIYAAEVGGVMQETLSRLSIYLKGKKQVKKQMKTILLYPKIVLFLVIFGSLIVAIVQDILPINLNTVLAASGVIIFFILLRDRIKLLFSKKRGEKILDNLKLKMWFLGSVYNEYLNKQFAELFISLFNTGLNIIDIFHLIGGSIENKVYAGEINAIGDRIEQGMSVANAVDKCNFFPFQLKSLLHLGEQTGEFDKNLDSYIQQKDLEISLNIKKIFLISYIVILFILSSIIIAMKFIFL